jgi:hypothetical protein
MKIEFEIDGTYIADLLILLYKILTDRDTSDESDGILTLIDEIGEATPSLLHQFYNETGHSDPLTSPVKALYLAVTERRGITPDVEILKHARHTES